jgi:hypothetical protein
MDKGGRTAALIHADSELAYRHLHSRKGRGPFDTVTSKARLKDLMVEWISVATRRPICELSATC